MGDILHSVLLVAIVFVWFAIDMVRLVVKESSLP
jgi:hypothetical protein